MRYIATGLVNDEDIIKERKKYLEHSFGLYFIPYRRSSYVEFISIPSDIHDLVIILGHNNDVFSFLKNENIKEEQIVMITCFTGLIKTLKWKKKKVYISKNKDGYTEMFKGLEWNINFNISLSELILYNNKDEAIDIKLSKSFERIN